MTTNALFRREVHSESRHNRPPGNFPIGIADVTVEIDLSGLQTHEAGARLLSYFAYPTDGEFDLDRSRYFLALCNYALRTRQAADPMWATTPQQMRPNQALVTTEEYGSWTYQGRRLTRERSLAGRIAMPFFAKAMFGSDIPLPPGVKRLSFAQVGSHYLAESGEADIDNLRRRTWIPSFPVIHLAVAFELYHRASVEAGGKGHHREVLVFDEALRTVVGLAEENEPHVECVKAEPSTLLRFRL